MPAHLHRKPTILWAEDDEDDQFFVKRALAPFREEFNVVFVADGEHAWDYLHGAATGHEPIEHSLPQLLVTDIKMPRCDGLELLARLRSDPQFANLPVFVFTSSDLFCDHEAAVRAGALGFAVKPLALHDWKASIGTIIEHARAVPAPTAGTVLYRA